jgi:hypothetical protein
MLKFPNQSENFGPEGKSWWRQLDPLRSPGYGLLKHNGDLPSTCKVAACQATSADRLKIHSEKGNVAFDRNTLIQPTDTLALSQEFQAPQFGQSLYCRMSKRVSYVPDMA